MPPNISTRLCGTFSATTASGIPPRMTLPSITSPITLTRCRPGSLNANPRRKRAQLFGRSSVAWSGTLGHLQFGRPAQTSAPVATGLCFFYLQAKPEREEWNAEMVGTGPPARHRVWDRVGAEPDEVRWAVQGRAQLNESNQGGLYPTSAGGALPSQN